MDEIRRKLEFIDSQLAGGIDFHKRIIGAAPLLFCAVGLIFGIVVQNFLFLPVLVWGVLLVCGAVSVVFCFIKRTNRLSVVAYLTLICFVSLGAVRLTSFYEASGDDIRRLVGEERQLANVRGLIVTKPYIAKNDGWEFSRFVHADAVSSFYLKVEEIKSVDGWLKTAGMVRVQVGEPVLDLKVGDYVQAYCWLSRFGGATNPGQFDARKYLERRGVFVSASVRLRDGIEVLSDSSKGAFTKMKRRIREAAWQSLLGGMLLEDDGKGLLEALLLGQRGNISRETHEAFRKTGLLHFISLSGMHFGILIGIIWWLCKTVGFDKPMRAVVCIIATGVFLIVVPLRAPTLRAAIICWVFCISLLFRRRVSPLNGLSLAAIILLLIRPTGLFEAGWQLSFTAVLGIILFTDRIHFFIYEKITDLPWRKSKRRTTAFFWIISKPGPYVLRLFSVGLAAWVGSAGVLLYHFYRVNLFSSVWTVLTFPIVAGILTIGFLKMLFSLLLPSVALVLGIVVAELADVLIWVVKLIASWDISEILLGKVSWLAILWYYGIVIFMSFVHYRWSSVEMRRRVCAVMVLGLVTFLGVSRWQRSHGDDLVVTCLNVGHGQAIVIGFAGGENILFDAGSLHNKDIGWRIVNNFLDYRGIGEIDSIVISHNDVDHINGIPEVVGHCKVGGVYANDAFFVKADKWGTAKFLGERLSVRDFVIQELEADFGVGADIKKLWPSEQVANEKDLSDNDQSLVLLVEFAGRKVLLCSDIEQFAQRQLLRENPGLRADILVVPHHGSVKTLDKDFLDSIGAEVLICSCGRRDYERQRTAERGDGAKQFYTARDGAVEVRISEDGSITTETFVR